MLDAIRVELAPRRIRCPCSTALPGQPAARRSSASPIPNIPPVSATSSATTLPWTLFLAGSATLLAFLIGTLLGIVAAWRRGGAVDSIVTPLTMFTYSFPPFFLAMLVLYFLGVSEAGFRSTMPTAIASTSAWTCSFITSAADHAALPVLAFLLYSDRRLAARHAQRDDQRALRRLRYHGAGEGSERPAGDAPLCGAQCPAAADHQFRDHHGLYHHRPGA